MVTKLDRLARSLPDARPIADELTTRQISLSLGGSVYDPTDAVGLLLFNVLAMVAEFESDLISLRTVEGMKVARAKGRLRGNQPKLNRKQEAHLVVTSRDARPGGQADARARLLPGDVLLVDEAGMLDQDTARALLTIADEAGARVAFVGDRHQLPAVGRGGVLDHAARWVDPAASLELDTVHRFADPEYADLSLLMRAGEVFDALVERGQVVLHPTEIERIAALARLPVADLTGGLVIADTRDQVSTLNAAIRDWHTGADHEPTDDDARAVTTHAGERIGVGDRVMTRRNDRELDVANRDTWTVVATTTNGNLSVRGRGGDRTLPASHVRGLLRERPNGGISR